MKISIIIPTMNEEESIGRVIDAIPRGEAAIEILVVDTNSKDRTKEIARGKGAKVIDEPRRGYGRAYKTGFANASGEVIITLDGDLTYPAERVVEFANMLMDKGLDFITCNRLSLLEPGVMSRKHRLGNWILTKTANLLFGLRLKDSQSGMWIFRREILDKMELMSDGMPLSEEIKVEAWRKGFRTKEIPIEYRARKGEVKLSTWKDGYNNLKFLFSKRFFSSK